MKDTVTWIEEIEDGITRLKARNLAHSYANFYVEMSKETANEIKKHFSVEKGYTTQVNMCPRMRWDIMITW